MTRTKMRMPVLAAGFITGALVVGAAGVATAHTPTGDTHRGAGMHGGQAGHGMHAGGHMGSGMMGSGMMGTIDEEGMAVTVERKVEIARRSYDILVDEFGLVEEVLLEQGSDLAAPD